MDEPRSSMSEQIARAALDLEKQRTGHAPKSVTVVLCDDSLVITLHGALTPAERAMAQNASGAAQLQELHEALFAGSSDRLRDAIQRITGLTVRDTNAGAAAEASAVIRVFPTGTVVQVVLLSGRVSSESWSGSGSGVE